MAKIIQNDYWIALESKDLQANAMSLDSTGTFVLLAGRKWIALKNLDIEYENVVKIPRNSKYDVGLAEWNPTSQNKELCAITTNERLEIFTWREETLTLTHSLRAHNRSITGLNWHKFNPNLLATASVDTFVNLWDLRDDLKRPILSINNVAESSQVKWNQISQYLFATAHVGDIKIWDQRKSNYPLQYFTAHLTKIYGLDWNPHNETQIVSASADQTVKCFDIGNPRKPSYLLNTGSPVRMARFTPFGNGLVTVVFPQQLRRICENSLSLWNVSSCNNRTTPMHTFIGHRDVVLDFQWRNLGKSQHQEEPNYQLVTWSKDQTLLVWKIESVLQKLCGYDEPDDLNNLDEADHSTTLSLKKIQPLQQEFSLLNDRIPNLEVRNMDAVNRSATVQCKMLNLLVTMQVTFPNSYPNGIAPVFQIISGSTMSDSMITQLMQTLNLVAQQRVAKNRTCLEPCLRQMVITLEQFTAINHRNFKQHIHYTDSNGYNDAYIPFPRTSGAKFCSVNLLVCFGTRQLIRRIGGGKNDTSIDGTPRALSSLEGILAKRSSDQMTISAAFYLQKQKQKSRSKQASATKYSKVTVHLYDATNLFLINRQLAEEYILDGDIATICKHNAATAAVVGRKDLIQAWTLIELTLVPLENDLDNNNWNQHPCGENLISSMIKYYAFNAADSQMAAMLCCIFAKYQANVVKKSTNNNIFNNKSLSLLKYSGSSSSPYHTIIPAAADVVPSADRWFLPILKSVRSTSLDNLKVDEFISNSYRHLHHHHHHPPKKQHTAYTNLYEYYKIAYAETLNRWGLLYNRAEVMKFTSVFEPPESSTSFKGVQLLADCQTCQIPVVKSSSILCTGCKQVPLKCIICNLAARAAVNCCLVCGHGGHADHIEMWFETKTQCPLCSCQCLIETFSVLS